MMDCDSKWPRRPRGNTTNHSSGPDVKERRLPQAVSRGTADMRWTAKQSRDNRPDEAVRVGKKQAGAAVSFGAAKGGPPWGPSLAAWASSSSHWGNIEANIQKHSQAPTKLKLTNKDWEHKGLRPIQAQTRSSSRLVTREADKRSVEHAPPPTEPPPQTSALINQGFSKHTAFESTLRQHSVKSFLNKS